MRHADSDGISDSSAFLCAYISPDEESDCGAECGADEQADGSTDGHTDGRTECGSERCADRCAYRRSDGCTDGGANSSADCFTYNHAYGAPLRCWQSLVLDQHSRRWCERELHCGGRCGLHVRVSGGLSASDSTHQPCGV